MYFQEFEEKHEILREKNYEYINTFQAELIQQGLSTKTINRHTDNIDFYLNNFLLWDELRTMDEGCYVVADFLGHFFIRKCMWSTPTSIRSNAISLKKFYKCMLSHGNIEKEQYEELCERTKDGIEVWVTICEQYNDFDEPNPFDMYS